MYLDNAGKEYPLKVVNRDNVTDGLRNSLSDLYKNCILDVKIKNAKKDKLYRLEWFSNGYTNAAIKHNRQIKIGIYDRDTFCSQSVGTVYDVPINQLPPENCVGIQYINCKIANVDFSFIINYDVITQTAVAFNSPSTYGYNSIIDEATYEYEVDEEYVISPLYITPNLTDVNKPSAYVESYYTNSTEQKLGIDFLCYGANELFAIYNMNRIDYRGSSYNGAIGNKTDWIGPYIVKSLSNETGNDIPGGYTGGVHGTKEASYQPTPGTNDATARTLSYKLYADGKILTTNDKTKAYDSIVIEVKNGIYAKNTILLDNPRYVLIENVRYTILPGAKINVDVSIDVLEDVFMQVYYGLQCGLNSNKFNKVYFPYGQFDDFQILSGRIESGDYKEYKYANEVIVGQDDSPDYVSIKLNKVDRKINSKLTGLISNCFVENTKKVYFNTIREVTLLKGFNIHWNGTYSCYYHI